MFMLLSSTMMKFCIRNLGANYESTFVHRYSAASTERCTVKVSEVWCIGDWFLHHSNAPAHSALSLQEFLAMNCMTVIPNSPYSSDLVLCYFFLFIDFMGKRFDDAVIKEISHLYLWS